MKTNLLKRLSCIILFLFTISALSQESNKKFDFSLSANYRTMNAKANSISFKDRNGHAEGTELLFGISFENRITHRLEVGISFIEFSSNNVNVFEGSVVNSSLGIRYLQVPIVMKSIFNLSAEEDKSSLIMPYIAYGVNISKHLDTREKSLFYSEKIPSEGWDVYFRGGFGLNFNLNKNWEASIGFEGVGPTRKKSSLNDKPKPIINGVYLQIGITYKF